MAPAGSPAAATAESGPWPRCHLWPCGHGRSRAHRCALPARIAPSRLAPGRQLQNAVSLPASGHRPGTPWPCSVKSRHACHLLLPHVRFSGPRRRYYGHSIAHYLLFVNRYSSLFAISHYPHAVPNLTKPCTCVTIYVHAARSVVQEATGAVPDPSKHRAPEGANS